VDPGHRLTGVRPPACARRSEKIARVQISAKSEYAVRALLELAARQPDLVKAETIVADQELPRKFVESILADLRRAGLVRSTRGADGGYQLTRPANEISLGAIIRAVDGPLAEVRGLRPHETTYTGVAEHLPEVWIALRANVRKILDETTLHQVLVGRLPAHVRRLSEKAESWLPR
jgi:Rrf2 family protein